MSSNDGLQFFLFRFKIVFFCACDDESYTNAKENKDLGIKENNFFENIKKKLEEN